MIIMSMVIIILSLDEIPLPRFLGAAGGGVGEGRAGQDGGETGGKGFWDRWEIFWDRWEYFVWRFLKEMMMNPLPSRYLPTSL